MATSASSLRETIVSAPGKVLVAGGYLVLDPAYSGLVLSTSSRFYCTARSHQQGSTSSASSSSASCIITIKSPQFLDAVWQYRASSIKVFREGTEVSEWTLEQTRSSVEKAGRNPFVSLALIYTLRLASEIKGFEEVQSLFQRISPEGIEITVVGDNDFYSQRETLDLPEGTAPSMTQLESLSPFTKQKCRISNVHKTGLGSSAAMTTSLVGCFLLHLQGILLTDDGSFDEEDLALIHNLAQLAHCAAQGKVGSGFDVSAAIWGSQLYRRFDPKVLQGCLDEGEKVFAEGQQTDAETSARLASRKELLPALDPNNPLWRPSPLSASSGADSKGSHSTAVEGLLAVLAGSKDEHQHELPRPAPLQLPPGLDLLLADVDAGSNTPSLVSKVLAWRKAKPEWAAQLYNVIAASNQSLADSLLRLRLLYASSASVYEETIDMAATKTSPQWDDIIKSLPSDTTTEATGTGVENLIATNRIVLQALIDTRNSLRSIRAGMRELGVRAGVPIEPPEIGGLIKKISDEVPGVVGGSIPGAGGFDAFYIIHLQSKSHQRDLPKLWDRIHKVKEEAESNLTLGPLLSRADGAKPLHTVGSLSGSDMVSELLQKMEESTLASQDCGLRVEKLDSVKGLKEVLAQ